MDVAPRLNRHRASGYLKNNPDLSAMNSSPPMGRRRKETTVHHHFRGVTISLYCNTRGTWEAGFTISGRKRGKATGPTERLCRKAACDKIRLAMDPGSLELWNDEEAARQILQELGVSLTESARFYFSQHSHPLEKVTVKEARAIWLKRLGGRKAEDQYHHIRSLTQRSSHLEATFGDRQISTVTSVELTHFQDLLELNLRPRTVRNIHDANKDLFKFCRKRGFLVPDRLSAAELVDRPQAEPGKKGIFTDEEMQRLIDTGWGYAMPGATPLVVTAFGSTRSEESSKQDPDAPLSHRIQWEDLNFAKGYTSIRAEVAKTREPRRAGLPKNLAAMLKPLRETGPLYANVRLDLAFAKIADKAGVTWKSNGLRHSCITYDVLLASNATEVALRSGTSIRMIEAHYLNTMATKDQARAWFRLRPRVAWGSLLEKPL
jgi:hypothetical protein